MRTLSPKMAAEIADYLKEQMDDLEASHKDYWRGKVIDVDIIEELKMVRRWIGYLRTIGSSVGKGEPQ